MPEWHKVVTSLCRELNKAFELLHNFFLCFSCDTVPWIEKRRFWTFEGILSVLGFFSGVAVYVRQKQLDHKMYQRIQRQIANNGP